MLRVLFIGQCPEIAVATAAAGHRLVGVTDPPPNPDRLRQLARVSLGRERRHPLVRAALSVRAERLPGRDVNGAEFLRRAKALEPDLILCAGWPGIFGADLLALPRLGCVNFHPSLLPRHRGPQPLAWTLLHGDTETGITFHAMATNVDRGDILYQERLPVLATDDYDALRDRCMVRGAAAVAHVLNGVEDATLRPVPQPIEGGSTERAPQLEDYALDWSLPVTELHNRARAVPRRSGVPAQIEGRAVVITGAAICPERHGDAPPGTVLSRAGNTLRIAASDGVLLVTTR